MAEERDPRPDETPTADQTESRADAHAAQAAEPSTEKPAGEEPKAPPSQRADEASHHAVGLGVIDDEETA